MDRDTPLGAALQVPLDRGWRHLLKGGAYTLFFWLIVPIFIIYGYMLRVLAGTAQDEDLPPLQGWQGLAMDGLRAIAVMLPLFLGGFLLGSLPLAVGVSETAASLVYQVVNLLVSYVAMMVLAVYAVERDWRAAYDYQRIVDLTMNVTYLTHFIVFWFLSLVLGVATIVVTVLSAITIIGPLVVLPTALFYVNLVTMVYWGRVYRMVAD